MSATVVYRHRDVIGQVGAPAFICNLFGYLGAHVIGLTVAHTVEPWAGAVTAFSIYIIFTLASLFIAKTPDSPAPSFWGRNAYLAKFWWMGAYSVSSKHEPKTSPRNKQLTIIRRATNSAAT